MTTEGVVLEGRLPTEGRRGLLRRVLQNPAAIACLVFLAIVILAGILAPLITPFDPGRSDLGLSNAPAGSTYLLGGDSSGRDILSRLVAAATVTVQAAVIATSIALVIGVIVGLHAGYFGRAWDAVGSWATNVLLTVPGIVILIALYAAVGPSLVTSMAVFGILLAPSVFRLVRGLVHAVRNELYIDAARVAGLSSWRIIRRHVLLVIRGPVIVQAAFIAEAAIVTQAGLEFLGLGDPGVPSWGGMLRDAFENIYTAPLQVVWPGVALALTVSALVLLGNAIRDSLAGNSDVRGRRLGPRRHRGARPATAAAVIAEPARTGAGNGAVLEINDLHVAYPTADGHLTEVVRGVSLHVDAGEVLGLVGQSGSGKSQTAFSALGILPREAVVPEGSIRVAGTEVLGAEPAVLTELRRHAISYIPQEPMSNLDPSFKVGSQLRYGVRTATGLDRAAARTVILDLFQRVGIVDPERTYDSYPHEISGGMAQRALIAGAVASNPQVLIADEPTTALDVTVQAEILDLLRDLQKERRMAVLLVTHNFGVVADLCDRVAVMETGRIVEVGAVAEIFSSPQHAYTRELLGSLLDEDHVRPDRRVGDYA